MNVIDLFAGAGGLSLGFEKAGFDVILANEYDREISNTYRLNHPHTLMIDSDIKEFVKDMEGTIGRCLEKNQFIQPESLFKKLDNIDVIIGGPPCQGFSMAGGRIRKVNEFVEDPRNELFKYYFEVIKRFEPKYFVFENVLGILSSKKGEIVRTIKSIFEDKNNFKNGRYYVSINIVNAADFGVAQARKRVIIFGAKAECDFNDLKLKTLNRLREHNDSRFDARPTVYDAISDLQKIAPSSNNGVPNHTATKHSEVAKMRMKKIQPNQNWSVLHENIKSIHSGSYGRLDWNKPATTITTRFDTPSAGRYIHPVLDRTLTPREAARIQSFPDDYIFYGSKSSICKQIGNAVPPLLAEFIANIIITLDYDTKR